MFINDAFADTTAAAVEAGGLSGTLIQLALILLIFYFFLIRPQQKKIKEHAKMIDELKIGNRVLTGSGIYGKITKIKDTEIVLEVAPGVEITIDRMSVGGVVHEPSAAKNALDLNAAKQKSKKTK